MSRHSKSTRFHTIGAPVRGVGVIAEREHDPYRERAKLAEPTVCPNCHAVYHEGRWQWLELPEHAEAHLCPACRRVRDGFPCGFVTLEGEFVRTHRDDVMAVVNNRVARARAEHALERVMGIQEQDGALVITTTDPHLARGIAEALHDAYRGELAFRYEESQQLLRAHWKR